MAIPGRVLAAVAGVLAALLLPLGIASAWVDAVVGDTDRYVDTVGPVADDPVVQRAVIAALDREALKVVDLGVRSPALVRFLTEHGFGALARSGGAVTGALREEVADAVHQAVRTVVTGPHFTPAWKAANRSAHTELIRVLDDEDGQVVGSDGRVSIELGTVLGTVLAGLQAEGLVPPGALPEVKTSFTLLKSDDLDQARRAYRVLDALGFWVPVAWLVCFVLVVLLSRRRVRATRRVLLGSLAGLLVLLLAVIWLGKEVADRSPDRDVTAAVWEQVTLGLRAALTVTSLVTAAMFTWLSTLLRNRIGILPSRTAVLTGRIAAGVLLVLAVVMVVTL
ncbi:MAG: hypothetical protein J7518_17260 [Nocardioidaceae bacterium]|nr:hypothetical protein [Nocardioidaceae bacterium]